MPKKVTRYLTPLARRLRAWRDKLDKTQTEMACYLDMPFRTYQDIERGVSRGATFTRASLESRLNKAKIQIEVTP